MADCFLLCNCDEEKTTAIGRDWRLGRTLPLEAAPFASPPSSSHQDSLTGIEEAVVGGNTATWVPLIPRRSKEYKSVYDVRLRPGRVLDGEDDPFHCCCRQWWRAPHQWPGLSRRSGARTDDVRKVQDKFSQGPRRADAIALPLGVQPSINSY
jgi:hypothetical protein